jgi:iron complex outermembrane recepter protein
VAASYFERDFKYEADNTNYEFLFGQFAAYTGYQWYDFSFTDHMGDVSQYGGDPRGFAFDGQKDKRTSFEARLSSHPGSRWSWLAGLFYNKTTSHAEFAAYMDNYSLTNSFQYYSDYVVAALGGNPLAPTDVWFRGLYDTSLKESAVFGEFGYDFTDHFNVTAGGRWFKYDESFTLHQEQPPGFDGYTYLNKTSSSSDNDHVSKLSLTYEFDSSRLLYFTYWEGFRT